MAPAAASLGATFPRWAASPTSTGSTPISDQGAKLLSFGVNWMWGAFGFEWLSLRAFAQNRLKMRHQISFFVFRSICASDVSE